MTNSADDLFRDLLKISGGDDPKPALDAFDRFHDYVNETVGRARRLREGSLGGETRDERSPRHAA